MITIVAIIIIVVAIIYAGLIFLFLVGWMGSSSAGLPRPSGQADGTDGLFFSVVVAARDEASRIDSLLDALSKQEWPAARFEILVVDDHSSDNTLALAEVFARKTATPCVRVISARIRGSLPGKKHALDLGIRDARGTFIVTTDADCQPSPGWLQAIASCIDTTQSDMVMGPVQIDGSAGCFAKMQELEFMSLMGVTGGAAAVGHPLMANGANLAFRKKLYVAVDGYEGNTQYASGDDVFLLHKFKHLPDCGIVFLKKRSAIVTTVACPSLKAFFRQRGRWAGKACGYKDRLILIVGAVVAMFNLMLLASMTLLPVLVWQHAVDVPLLWGVTETSSHSLSGFTVSEPMVLFAALSFAWLMKGLSDLSMLISVTRFFKRSRLLWYFLPVFLVYPIYVAVSLIRGLRN
jgi:poly-beta-1,6-N-acetyl-D-glucosamine synthase